MYLPQNYYLNYNQSPVFVSNNLNELSAAMVKLENLGTNPTLTLCEVPSHHETSAYRLRVIPCVIEALKS